MDTVTLITKNQLKGDFPAVQPGATVRVYQKVQEGDKTRTQIFEGIVIARKHGKGINATITVRKVISGVGVREYYKKFGYKLENTYMVKTLKK